MARKTYTGAPTGCGATFTVDADLEALTVYSATVTPPAAVEGTGGSRTDTHTITVDVFGGNQLQYLGSTVLATKDHAFPSLAVTGSDTTSTWVATTAYPTARRISVHVHHSNTSAGATTADGKRLDISALAWGPASKPVDTIIATGTVDLGSPGSPAEFEWRVKISTLTGYGSCDGGYIPGLSVEVRRKPGSGYPGTTNLAVDFMDDRGNWYETTNSVSSASWLWADWHSGVFSSPAHVAAAAAYASRFPGGYMPLLPTKISVRRNTDGLGTARYGISDIMFLEVAGPTPSTDIPFAIKVGFDVSMDTYTPGTTSVTGDTPAITDGTHTVVAQPDPSTGGIKVTDGAGNTVGTTGPLPGGPVNGPITLRIDGDTLMVIYAGDVVWVYKLADLPWWNLSLSTVYVGIWNPSTHVVTPTTPTYPPLGGWRYRLFSRLKVPGIKPRLFGAWAHTWAGLTWVTDASSAYSTMGGWEASLATDPTVVVYPGGQEWLITAQEATKIAAAGGLEFLEEVTP